MERRLAGKLLIDLKVSFDLVSRNCLITTMEGLRADGDPMRWTRLFMSDRSVNLVIDGHQRDETALDNSIPQGPLISPILFIINLSGVFKEVEK